MKVKLICDSLCDTPKELIEKYNIEVIPLNIILGDKEYKEGIDISNEDFYKRMKEIKQKADFYLLKKEIICYNG